MKLLNFLPQSAVDARAPLPLTVPAMDSVRVDLRHHPVRSGGDYFDALAVDSVCLVFLSLEVAARHVNTMELAACVQDEFRSLAPKLFAGVSEPAEALSELCLHLNRTILETAGRAQMTAAFLGALNAQCGTLAYINAGHAPGLLLAERPTEFLGSTGLPLGIFSHATHEACFRVIPRGGALLMVSRGVVEARSESYARPKMCAELRSRFAASCWIAPSSMLGGMLTAVCRWRQSHATHS
jgi:serine phosphatase RsbU (regulator of sigma subunit)